MAELHLGLGGNLGDPLAAIEDALARLDRAGVSITARSGFYRTPPWGVTDQPDFINLCAAAETDLRPLDLLAVTQATEAALGRVRDRRWGPRAIDIDILTYDGIESADPRLTLPHPRIVERVFVLVPLAEIAPDLVVAGRSVRERAAACDPTGIVRIG